MADGLQRQGFNVETVPPQGTKWMTGDKFKRMTGWKGRTSEHSRDAAMLICQHGATTTVGRR